MWFILSSLNSECRSRACSRVYYGFGIILRSRACSRVYYGLGIFRCDYLLCSSLVAFGKKDPMWKGKKDSIFYDFLLSCIVRGSWVDPDCVKATRTSLFYDFC